MYVSVILLFLIGSKISLGQNSSDVLKFSMARTSSSARFEGMGSSFGAIGTDQASLDINPAGLGLYRKPELSFGIYNKNINGVYSVENNSPFQSGKFSNYGLSNLGLVLIQQPNKYSKWKSVNFFIGYNLTSSLNQELNFEGKSKGSILHRFLENSIDPNSGLGIDPGSLDPFEGKLAYETGALYDISPDSAKIIYTNDLIDYRDSLINKNGSNNYEGYLGNISLGLAANYNEKIMLGANINVVLGNYSFEKRYNESDPTNKYPPFHSLTFNDYSSSNISGFKAVFGIIYKPVNKFRIGLSWHTPSILTLQDSYNTSLSYSFYNNNNLENYNSNSPDGFYEYNIIVPSRWVGSFAYVSNFGLLNVDLDFFNPGYSKFKFNEESESNYENQINADIKKQYKQVLQTRIGLEIPIQMFRIRGGFGIFNSPYKNDSDLSYSYSAGLGFRAKRIYLDLSGKRFKHQEAYLPFATANSDFNNDRIPDAVETLIQSSITEFQFIITLGIKFR